MRKFFFVFLFSLFFFLRSFLSYSQGCSDAGVCTVGSLSLIQFKYEILPIEINTLSKISVEDVPLTATRKEEQNSIEREKQKSNNSQKQAGIDTTKYGTPPLQVLSSVDSSGNRTKSNAFHYYYKYPKYYFHFTTYYGIGERGTTIITPQLEVNAVLVKQQLFAQVKVPVTFISGNLGRTNGLSDITLSMSYLPFSKKKNNIVLTAGVKIPNNKANISNDSIPLPMVYQTSLGSTDILAGIKFKYKKWNFTAGYQHAFNANGNQYLHHAASDIGEYNSYFESKELKRADDGVFRANRNIQYKRISVEAGLLFIYHLQNDVITTAAGKREEAKGSQGLTLNLNIAASLPVSKHVDATFIIANPVITREARPDGLGRKLVLIIGLKYNIY